MSDFLTNLARRGAGLPLVSPATPIPAAGPFAKGAADRVDVTDQPAARQMRETLPVVGERASDRPVRSTEAGAERVVVPISAASAPLAQRSHAGASAAPPSAAITPPPALSPVTVTMPTSAPAALTPNVTRSEVVVHAPSLRLNEPTPVAPLPWSSSSHSDTEVPVVLGRSEPVTSTPFAPVAAPVRLDAREELRIITVPRLDRPKTLLTGGPAIRLRSEAAAASAPPDRMRAPQTALAVAASAHTRAEFAPDERVAASPHHHELVMHAGDETRAEAPSVELAQMRLAGVEPARLLTALDRGASTRRATARELGESSPLERVVQVRIGTVEIHAATIAPVPQTTAPPAAALTLPAGFDDVVSLRTYAPWKW